MSGPSDCLITIKQSLGRLMYSSLYAAECYACAHSSSHCVGLCDQVYSGLHSPGFERVLPASGALNSAFRARIAAFVNAPQRSIPFLSIFLAYVSIEQ